MINYIFETLRIKYSFNTLLWSIIQIYLIIQICISYCKFITELFFLFILFLLSFRHPRRTALNYIEMKSIDFF